RLTGEERERLETLIRKGKSPARRVLKARILLKADVSEAGKGWSDNRIIEALETSPSMVYRVRKQLVEEPRHSCKMRLPGDEDMASQSLPLIWRKERSRSARARFIAWRFRNT